jgi:hypothetical protein
MSDAPASPGGLPAQSESDPEQVGMAATAEAPAPDAAWEDEPLPGRPRRRFLTPLTAVLFAALAAGGGFIGGVQSEKGQVTTSSTGGGRGAGRSAGLGAGAGGSGRSALGGLGGGGGGAANATIGQVANVSGSDVYVTDLQGNTIRVHAASAQVTRQVTATPSTIHPGDTVIAQGSKGADGSVQATTIRDSGAGTGGGTGGAASSSGSGSASGGGSGGGAQSLFGPSRGG